MTSKPDTDAPEQTAPQLYRPPNHVGVLVHEVARIRRKVVDKVLRPLNITRAQRWVLIYLQQFADKGVSQRELADAMQIGQVAVGERLALLEAIGCIERHHDARDRRQKLIKLTAEGQRTLQQSRTISDRINKEILDGIPAEDIVATERTLRAMHANLSRIYQE